MADTIRDELARWLYINSEVSTPIVDEALETMRERPWEWLTGASQDHYSEKADGLLSSSVVARIRAEAWDQAALTISAYSSRVSAAVFRHGTIPERPANPYREATA